MNDTNKTKYLPFQAVNEFMREDYRLSILHEVFNHLDKCTAIQKQLINRLVAKGVQIAGFRNSSLAPLPIKIKNSVSLFENSSEFAATIIECWSNLHPELKKALDETLTEKGWQPLAYDLDRSLLPGFMIDWPKKDTFELLIKTLRDTHPNLLESEDNISLMAVWVGNRLPYNLYNEEEATL
ncbi:MAG: hypothetical protein FD147_846 [Chloroflexi bacterium]|nr:MAG: hypothetical protein FD147_846 [Chloroflexota bacterium]MBA4375853.1 hypothetical protein [Anaerolinea sp.]